jgi:hypothetical protein
MIDLKPYFDAANAAEAEVQRIAHEMDALFRQETDEAKAQALAMQPELEKAQQVHTNALALYESMQKANRPNDIAKNFVPVSNTQPNDAEGTQPSVIKRQEYDRMSLVDRARFIRSGGTLED